MTLLLASMAVPLALIQAASAQAPLPPAAGCASEAHAAFDFWVGEWDVFPAAGGEQVAVSSIERMHDGCLVREHWQPFRGGGGSSLSSLDPASGRWHQTWVGAGSGRVEFVGGPAAGAMVLTGLWPDVGGPGRDGLVRMTYTPAGDGSVRQHGEASFDHGLTWATSFDFLYRRRAR